MQDRDDDFSDESEDEQTKQDKNELRDFTFIPGSKPSDNKGRTFLAKSVNEGAELGVENLSSSEQIRTYLEGQLGLHLLDQIYPIIKSFEDNILLSDKIGELQGKLKHLITPQQVNQYYNHFATWVFYEMQKDRSHQEDPEGDYDPSGMLNVINCFKDVAVTATFGKFGMKATIGKKY